MGRPDVLNKFINKINNKFPKIRKKIKKKNSTINRELNKIFDYDKFSRLGPKKNKPNRWRAYQLTKELNLNVCPYCNRQYITTYYSSSGKVRAELDHFFDKKRHPYFALSFYNLIPSCHVCNSNLKGSKEFKYKKNLHPYESGFGDNLKFTIKIKENQKTNNEDLKYDLDFFYGDSEQFEINFKESIKKESDKDLIRKAKNNAEIFKIKELYNSHKNHIAELIKKINNI
ncbi:hypothetical protein [Halanaerobium praevalens]|uniref:hypothetical protein n=1 Tax=Halanaerobium praevalens TaxID=2331 RepID=UPI0003078B5E|nr:hypothetical protein [Halanaerobium praevalens]